MTYCLVEYHKTVITLKFDSSNSLEKLIPYIQGLRYKQTQNPKGRIIEIAYKDECWSLYDEYFDENKITEHFSELCHSIFSQIISHISDLTRDRYCFHAAAVAKDKKAIVMPAISGSGKSSLTCWMLSNGLDYVSDELITIDSDGHIDGFSRPIQIKSYGVDAINAILDDDKKINDTDDYISCSPELFGSQYGYSNELELHCILLPSFSPEITKNTLTPITSAERGMHLVKNSFNLRNFPSFGFKELLAATDAPTFRLDYHDFASLSFDWLSYELNL